MVANHGCNLRAVVLFKTNFLGAGYHTEDGLACFSSLHAFDWTKRRRNRKRVRHGICKVVVHTREIGARYQGAVRAGVRYAIEAHDHDTGDASTAIGHQLNLEAVSTVQGCDAALHESARVYLKMAKDRMTDEDIFTGEVAVANEIRDVHECDYTCDEI